MEGGGALELMGCARGSQVCWGFVDHGRNVMGQTITVTARPEHGGGGASSRTQLIREKGPSEEHAKERLEQEDDDGLSGWEAVCGPAGGVASAASGALVGWERQNGTGVAARPRVLFGAEHREEATAQSDPAAWQLPDKDGRHL
jgi:hypothetical protein